MHLTWCMAEREGFEPSIPLLAGYTISNRAPSASRASLRLLLISNSNSFVAAYRLRRERGMCSLASPCTPCGAGLRSFRLPFGSPNQFPSQSRGRVLIPLNVSIVYLAMHLTWFVAERVGFEPTSPFERTAFRERRLKPTRQPLLF
jgi:hypothetical protein